MKKVSKEELEWLIYRKALEMVSNWGYTSGVVRGLCYLLRSAKDVVTKNKCYGNVLPHVPNFNIEAAINSGFLTQDNCGIKFRNTEDFMAIKSFSCCYWWESGYWLKSGRLGFLMNLYLKMCHSLDKPILTNAETCKVLKEIIKIHKNSSDGICCHIAQIVGVLSHKENKTFEDTVLWLKLSNILDNGLETARGLSYPKLVSFLGGKVKNIYWWKCYSKRRLIYLRILLMYYKIKMLIKA